MGSLLSCLTEDVGSDKSVKRSWQVNHVPDPCMTPETFTANRIPKRVISATSSGYGSHVNSVCDDDQIDLDCKHCMSPNERRKVLQNFGYLKHELDPQPIIDLFVQDDDLNEDDLDELKANTIRSAKVDLLLRKILRLRSEHVFQRFLVHLQSDYARQGYIYQQLTMENTLKALVEVPYTGHYNWTKRLKTHTEYLLHEMEPDQLVIYFIMYGEITMDDYEEYLQSNTRKKKCQFLLEYTGRKVDTRYPVLLTAFRETDRPDMISYLQTRTNTSPILHTYRQTNNRTIVEKRSRSSNEDTTKLLETIPESDQWEMHLTFDEHHVDRETLMKSDLNLGSVRFQINSKLTDEMGCYLINSTTGSVVLHLKICASQLRKLSSRKGMIKTVMQILEIVFNQEDISKLFLQTEVKFKVKLRAVSSQPEHMSNKPLDTKTLIENHKDLLVEELHALEFCKIFSERGLLEKKDVETIMAAKSRRDRTKLMLEKILITGPEGLLLFKAELEEQNKFVFAQLWPSYEELQTFEYVANNLEVYSSQLVDNMSPSLIASAVKGLHMPHNEWGNMFAKALTSRETRARTILDYVIRQDDQTRVEFVHILHEYGQLPHMTDIPQLRTTQARGKRATRIVSKTCDSPIAVGSFSMVKEQKYKSKFKHLPRVSTEIPPDKDSAYDSMASSRRFTGESTFPDRDVTDEAEFTYL